MQLKDAKPFACKDSLTGKTLLPATSAEYTLGKVMETRTALTVEVEREEGWAVPEMSNNFISSGIPDKWALLSSQLLSALPFFLREYFGNNTRIGNGKKMSLPYKQFSGHLTS